VLDPPVGDALADALAALVLLLLLLQAAAASVTPSANASPATSLTAPGVRVLTDALIVVVSRHRALPSQ
jgi:hypothetical protein